MKKYLFILVASAAALSASADLIDRPSGIKIGQRMTLRPYVSFHYTWDTNAKSVHDSSEDGHSWVISPALGLEYIGDNWNLVAQVYYSYHAYSSQGRETDDHSSFGQSLAFSWSSGGSFESDPWSFILSETFSKKLADDDMTNSRGTGNGRTRWQMNVAAGLNHRFTERVHAGINASFNYLDYDNDKSSYNMLYGWQNWSAGANAGYVVSPWTDFQISGTYSGYLQDNVDSTDTNYSNDSYSYSVHAGVGSYMTKKIQYRIMGGWTRFCYSGGDQKTDGFTYSASANWRIAQDWQTMLLASGSYHPSEYAYASSTREDSVSWGLAHNMVRGKLNATLDITYRCQSSAYCHYDTCDYNIHGITARVGLNYSLNRFVSFYGNCEFHTNIYDERDTGIGEDYDYNRFRLTIGFSLTY